VEISASGEISIVTYSEENSSLNDQKEEELKSELLVGDSTQGQTPALGSSNSSSSSVAAAGSSNSSGSPASGSSNSSGSSNPSGSLAPKVKPKAKGHPKGGINKSIKKENDKTK